MTERTTLPLSAHRDLIFAVGARMVLPSHDTVLRAFDKRETTRLASQLGVVVPRTEYLNNYHEARDAAETLSYPVVLKAAWSEEPSSPNSTRTTGAPAYARNSTEFLAAFQEMNGRSASVLTQEYLEGAGVGYFALVRSGQVKAEFAHRRLRDVRPTGSGSSLRESIAPSESLRSAGRAILESLGWHGVAMVEFRQRTDGVPVFLEVNGRFWNSLALAIAAGVDFPALLAHLAEHGDVEIENSYRVGVRCRWLLGDFRHLIEVWRGAPRGYPGKYPGRLKTTVSVLMPRAGTYHDNFKISDPLPEIGDWLDFALRRIPAQIKKKNSRKGLRVERRYSHS
jgi:predicted ATP-grasp superfamily ATP-dependent carboligase